MTRPQQEAVEGRSKHSGKMKMRSKNRSVQMCSQSPRWQHRGENEQEPPKRLPEPHFGQSRVAWMSHWGRTAKQSLYLTWNNVRERIASDMKGSDVKGFLPVHADIKQDLGHTGRENIRLARCECDPNGFVRIGTLCLCHDKLSVLMFAVAGTLT